jgi:hypothetical protein
MRETANNISAVVIQSQSPLCLNPSSSVTFENGATEKIKANIGVYVLPDVTRAVKTNRKDLT